MYYDCYILSRNRNVFQLIFEQWNNRCELTSDGWLSIVLDNENIFIHEIGAKDYIDGHIDFSDELSEKYHLEILPNISDYSIICLSFKNLSFLRKILSNTCFSSDCLIENDSFQVIPIKEIAANNNFFSSYE